MSYVRFGDKSDIYMYPSIYGGIECCSCSLAELVNTFQTRGDKTLAKLLNDASFGEPCRRCGGAGCEQCMMHGNTTLWTRSEAIKHIRDHRKAGHKVPGYADRRIKEELGELGETRGITKPRKDEAVKTNVQLRFRNWADKSGGRQIVIFPWVGVFWDEATCISIGWMFWCLELWINATDDLT